MNPALNTLSTLKQLKPLHPVDYRKFPRYPRPNSQRVKALTIAAGFVCHNGVVLGADSEITHSTSSKAYQSRIHKIHPDIGIHFVYAGDVADVRGLVEKTRKQTGLLHNPFGRLPTPDECFEIICAEYQAMIEKQLKKPADQVSWSELLVAVRQDMTHLAKAEIDFETTLYHLNGDQVTPVDRFEFIGIGNEVGRAIFDPLYQKESVLESVFSIINAIRRVKTAVPGCDGPTHVLTVKNSGEWPIEEVGQLEIEQIEKDSEFLDKQLRLLYQWFPSSMPDESFGKNLDVLRRQMIEQRSKPNRVKFPYVRSS